MGDSEQSNPASSFCNPQTGSGVGAEARSALLHSSSVWVSVITPPLGKHLPPSPLHFHTAGDWAASTALQQREALHSWDADRNGPVRILWTQDHTGILRTGRRGPSCCHSVLPVLAVTPSHKTDPIGTVPARHRFCQQRWRGEQGKEQRGPRAPGLLLRALRSLLGRSLNTFTEHQHPPHLNT